MAEPTRSTPEGDSANPITIPVYQEYVHVHTEMVDTGRGVRVTKQVDEQPYTINETLVDEDLRVERIAIDQLVAPADAPVLRYEGDTLVVPVLEEVLVTERRVRVKEEIRITKTKRARPFSTTVSLKSEAVMVQALDATPVVPPK